MTITSHNSITDLTMNPDENVTLSRHESSQKWQQSLKFWLIFHKRIQTFWLTYRIKPRVFWLIYNHKVDALVDLKHKNGGCGCPTPTPPQKKLKKL